ncbi:MAG: FecR domain-containing protein [Polyangiaceae bacterium]
MSSPRPRSRGAETLLRAWSEERVPGEDPAIAADRRKVVVHRMATRIREAAETRTRTRRRARWFGPLAAAAAAAVVLGAGAWRGLSAPPAPAAATHVVARAAMLEVTAGDVVVVAGGARSLAPRGSALPLAQGDEIVTGPEATARLDLEGGAHLEVGAATRLRLTAVGAASERIGISAGQVAVQVPKLAAGQTFGVLAPDAEVIVRGTAFEVAVRARADGVVATFTTVNVSEGTVRVDHAAGVTEVTAGQRWSSAEPVTSSSAADAPAAPDAAAGAPRPARPRGSGPATPAGAAARLPASPASELAEENRLFQAAMAHKRRGDDRAAVAVLESLLAAHPRSPLRPEAELERTRALQRLNPR